MKTGSHLCRCPAARHRSFPRAYSHSRARSPSHAPILAASRADPSRSSTNRCEPPRHLPSRPASSSFLAGADPSPGFLPVARPPPPLAAPASSRRHRSLSHVQVAAPCCPHGGAAPTRCPLRAGTGCLDASRGTRVCLSAIELQWPDA